LSVPFPCQTFPTLTSPSEQSKESSNVIPAYLPDGSQERRIKERNTCPPKKGSWFGQFILLSLEKV